MSSEKFSGVGWKQECCTLQSNGNMKKEGGPLQIVEKEGLWENSSEKMWAWLELQK